MERLQLLPPNDLDANCLPPQVADPSAFTAHRPKWSRTDEDQGPLVRQPTNASARAIRMLLKTGAVLIELRRYGERLPGGGIATGKEPVRTGWPDSKRAELAEIREWIRAGRNYGVLPATGGMCVLDIERAGCAHFNIKDLPDEALVVDTAGGGLHIYMDLTVAEELLGPIRSKRVLKKNGVILAELIARKGQVVGPGSVAFSQKSNGLGAYVVRSEGRPLRDKMAMAKLLRPILDQESEDGPLEPPRSIRTTTTGRLRLEAATTNIRAASQGSRHKTFLANASDVYTLVRAKQISESEADEALTRAYRDTLPDEMNDMARCLRDAREYGLSRVLAAPDELARAASGIHTWYSASELPTATPDDDIVRSLIRSGEVACLAGHSGAGKSFLALELAVCIAGGRPTFLGMKVQRHGPVLYLAGEGVSGLQTRIRAADPRKASETTLRIQTHIPPLTSLASVDAFLKSALQEINRSLAGQMPVLCIVDTTACGLAGADENSNSAMATLVSNVRRIANALNCAVMLIHHSPKKKEPGFSFLRGASALPAALDVVLGLRQVPESPHLRTLSTEKQRDRASNAVWSVEFETIKVGDTETLRVGKSSRIMETGSVQLSMQKAELRKSTDEEDLVEALAGLSPGGAKKAAIVSALRQVKGKQWSQKKVTTVLGRCEKKHWIKQEGAARNTVYKLLPAGEAVAERVSERED